MRPLGRARYLIVAGIVYAGAFALYWRTLLPDVSTWDTAEYQAIGPVLGIAHPTGYPTYTLLAWAASVLLQPFGNEAYRADLLSALLLAGAAALTAVAAVQLTRRSAPGILAGLALAVTPIAWRVATRAEAHALHGFLAALLLVLLIEWMRRREASVGSRRRLAGRWLLAAAVVYGISLGNHALTLLLAPGIAVFVLLVQPRILRQRPRLVVACLGAALGVAALVYAYLPIRSAMDPPLDYASPRTWGSFWYVVLGEQFQGSIRPLPSLPDTVAAISRELTRNLGPLLILVPAGALGGALRQPRVVAMTALWFIATWLFALGYANAVVERYYLVPLMVACLWLALAADVLLDAISELGRMVTDRTRGRISDALGVGLVILLLVVTLAPVPARYGTYDASGQTFGRRWLDAALDALEPDAVVVSWWSFSTPLWYGRWVERRRDDILIVDDRDVIDDGYGTAEDAVERWLGERPVYVVRLARDLPKMEARFELERVEGVPSPGDLYRVTGRRSAASPLPAAPSVSGPASRVPAPPVPRPAASPAASLPPA